MSDSSTPADHPAAAIDGATEHRCDVAVIGGGPAGLMAAEAAISRGANVHLFDAMGSVGRKFLLCGKGGLNLTHSEAFPQFVTRYREQAKAVADWLREFGADELRAWALGLGVDTLVGSSGRVFPRDFKAAPLLRAWVRRLRAQGVQFHMHARWIGWNEDGSLRIDHAGRIESWSPTSCVLALGGASWPVLGSDGQWTALLAEQQVPITTLQPANVGFECSWSEHFRSRHSAQPVKPVALLVRDAEGRDLRRQGEFVITDYGVEGSLIYAMGAELRAAIARGDVPTAQLDLLPERSPAQILDALHKPRGGRSWSDHLRRTLGLSGVRLALLRECSGEAPGHDLERLAQQLKALPLALQRARPLAEAISTAGGVKLSALNSQLMLTPRPGVFCAGEMLDWEAPTGGYLLTACFSSGRRAGLGAADWALQRPRR